MLYYKVQQINTMSENFKKIKKRITVEAAVKSAVAGISCGLFSVGILLLILKLSSVGINAGYYVLMGVGVSAAVSIGLFLYLKPTDAKLAVKLDGEYSLNEKIQTMVTYSYSDGEMHKLQREDADAKLKGLPPRKIAFSKIWYFLLAAMLAVAMFLTGVLVPVKDVANEEPPAVELPPEEGEKKFEYTLFLQNLMAQLIREVRECSLDEEQKSIYVLILTDLDKTLKTVEYESGMKSAVLGAVEDIDEITAAANSGEKLSAKIKTFGEDLASAISGGIKIYKSAGSLNSIERVESIKGTLGDAVTGFTSKKTANTLNGLKVPKEEGLENVLNTFIVNIAAALAGTDVAEDDLLFASLKTFANELSGIVGNLGPFGNDTLYRKIEEAFKRFENNFVDSLVFQNFNCMMDVFTRRKLADIFGLDYSELPELPYDDSENGEGSGGSGNEGEGGIKDPEGGNQGGMGDGNEIYGSDDLIYNPDTGEFVKYGELLEEYHSKVLYLLMNGDWSDETKRYIEKYYEILFGGVKQDEPDEK